MVISTGMRTDIPAFYSKWLVNRLIEGFVYVRNPYYPHQVTEYSLSPDVVDCITFCTKNPTPIIPYLDKLDAYRQFWFVTITPYGKDIEPHVPDKDKVIDSFKIISERVGKKAIGWRYDPVFYGKGFDEERHVEAFKHIAEKLNGYTDSCVLSFLDLYQKVKRNAPGIYPPNFNERKLLAKLLVPIAKQNGITIRTCCEGEELAPLGIDVSGCQTRQIIERAIGEKLDVPNRKNQRRGACDCLLGSDIGAYDTCGHLCKYCYANAEARLVYENMKMHDPTSPFLVGKLQKGDEITKAKQFSYIDGQRSFL
ncbi:MAG: DUF1848 domain-containing protein [Clostridia bacterium]|nr:DUF1848 domain-containing protein [Clostridia bacterium]